MLNYTKPKTLNAKLWQDSGFELVYIQDPSRRELLKAKKASTPVLSVGQVPQLRTLAQEPKEETFISHEVLYQDGQKINVEPEFKPTATSSPRSSEEAREQNEEKVSFHGNIIKEYEWPEEWQTIWNKAVKHQSPKVAWTYTGLNADMFEGKEKNEERRALISKLVKELHRPGGTHVFIPYDMRDEAGSILLSQEKSFFWSAISRLKVRQILVFGSKARDELQLPSRGVNSSFIYKGYKIYLLNDINRLVGLKSDGKDMLAYIDAQLSSVNL